MPLVTQSSSCAGKPGKTRAAGVVMAQVLGLAALCWLRRHALNPDGVAYVRIAGYYAHGRTDLAVSGYWGPLLSWLMTPWLAAGFPPLVAARIVMAMTAVIFLLGCLRVFRAFQLSGREQFLGAWLGAAVSVCWSVENISPDLLAGGLIGFAFSGLLESQCGEKPSAAVSSGIWWGLAYLAKAAALPLALLVSFGTLAIIGFRNASELKRAARLMLGTWFCIVLVAGPWVAVVSAKYHHLTISRSAALNHAMVGPAGVERFYPLDRGFYEPEPGRVTFWEDPDLPYPDWSPLESWANALHQLDIIRWNLPVVVFMLACVSLVFPVLLVILPARLTRPEWRRALAGQQWPWALLPVAAMGVAYAGGNLLLTEQRYFYAAFPFLFVAGAGACFHWKRNGTPVNPRRAVTWLMAAAFLAPTLARPSLWRQPAATAGECAWVMAQKLSAAGIRGPVAGSASMPGGRAGLYVAFHLGEPWYGYPRRLTAEEFRQSRALIIVVNREEPLAAELVSDGHFENLDGRLFSSPVRAEAFPLQAFELKQPGPGEQR
jgi:hypothetical protein